MRALILSFMLLLVSCSKVAETAVRSVAGAVIGGAEGVSVDARVGKNVARTTVEETKVTDVRVTPVVRDNTFENLKQDTRTPSGGKNVGAENVGVINNNHVPTWLILLFAAFVPTIWQWPRLLKAAFLKARAQD